MSTIVAKQLTRRYGARIGIDRVDIEVPAGSIYGFLGPNGAGKTTAIRIMLGFLRPSAGRASIFGLDCWRESPRIKRDVGYLPGDLRLWPWMTGASAITFAGRVRGADLARAGSALAERFELDLAVPVRSMSRGMRQKLGLILALAHEPRLLVLDEPTASLDPIMQDRLARTLRERAAEGSTIFFSSHTLSEVEQLCDRVAFVRRGRIVADEPLDVLRARAKREVVLRFADAAAALDAGPPSSLDFAERDGATWRGSLASTAPELVRWCATRPIADLTIGPPDLEKLFHRYYESDEDGA